MDRERERVKEREEKRKPLYNNQMSTHMLRKNRIERDENVLNYMSVYLKLGSGIFMCLLTEWAPNGMRDTTFQKYE